jgi:hypothetical protein
LELDEDQFNLKKSKNNENIYQSNKYLHARLYDLKKSNKKMLEVEITPMDYEEESPKLGVFQHFNGYKSYLYRGPRNGVFIYSPQSGNFVYLTDFSFIPF